MKADLRLTWKWDLQVSCLELRWITPYTMHGLLKKSQQTCTRQGCNESYGVRGEDGLWTWVLSAVEFPTKATFEERSNILETLMRFVCLGWIIVNHVNMFILAYPCTLLIIKWCKVHSKADIDLSYANSSALRPKRGVSTHFGSKAFERNRCVVRKPWLDVFRAFPSCSLSSNTVTLCCCNL